MEIDVFDKELASRWIEQDSPRRERSENRYETRHLTIAMSTAPCWLTDGQSRRLYTLYLMIILDCTCYVNSFVVFCNLIMHAIKYKPQEVLAHDHIRSAASYKCIIKRAQRKHTSS